jgi:hypothetical protein
MTYQLSRENQLFFASKANKFGRSHFKSQKQFALHRGYYLVISSDTKLLLSFTLGRLKRNDIEKEITVILTLLFGEKYKVIQFCNKYTRLLNNITKTDSYNLEPFYTKTQTTAIIILILLTTNTIRLCPLISHVDVLVLQKRNKPEKAQAVSILNKSCFLNLNERIKLQIAITTLGIFQANIRLMIKKI